MNKMTKKDESNNIQIIGVNVGSVSAFMGTLFSLFGLVAAIFYSFSTTVQFTQSTDSVLQGLAFGLARGIVAIIFLPFIYFLFGALMGFLYAVIFNGVAKSMGGIGIDIVRRKKGE